MKYLLLASRPGRFNTGKKSPRIRWTGDWVGPRFGLETLIRSACNNPYPTAFPYGNGMVLHFYQQQESSTTKTVHKVINKGLKTYV